MTITEPKRELPSDCPDSLIVENPSWLKVVKIVKETTITQIKLPNY
jgi:hypothetical protein